MQNTLHILNGDATLTGFNDTGLEGDTLVWREVLSEGPLNRQLEAKFWQMRSDFISTAFNATPEHYDEWIKRELEKLSLPYLEINLWFEFDLHCQLNMLGVMQLLKQQVDLTQRAIYLICPDSCPGVDDFRGMGQLNGEQLEYMFNGRVQLTDYDFLLAAEAWEVYLTQDGARVKQWIEGVLFWGSLHLLKSAMEAHVKRLTVNEHGHNYIEQQLLAIHHTGISDRIEIYRQFWLSEKIYGMGDAELNIYLNRLGI